MWGRDRTASLSSLHRPAWTGITNEVADWLRYLKSKEDKLGAELDLAELRPGDALKVVTQNADYFLTIVEGRTAVLSCSAPGRPAGQVQITGCTFGQSSSIKPDHLFCGGNLELRYQLEGAAMKHTTTAIQEIHLQRRGP